MINELCIISGFVMVLIVQMIQNDTWINCSPLVTLINSRACHYIKNPYPLRNRTICNKATIRAQESRGCSCQVGNYVIPQWVSFVASIP